MPIPYIGITDFTSFAQVERMLEVFKAHLCHGQKRRLHVGVMMSYKTLNGFPTKWADAYPPKETIAGIFASPETMNCLHYADYDGVDVYECLVDAIGWGGSGINALQLDMVWPPHRAIKEAVRTSGKQLEVILQVGANAIEEANNDPLEVVDYLALYEGTIHGVLLDKSMGRGLGMDAQALIPFAEAIKKRFPSLMLVAAGGLGPHSIDLIQPLAEKFPDISTDAQGQLRSSGDALYPIEWDRAEAYLIRALALLK